MVSISSPTREAERPNEEASAAIGELIGEFGIRCVLMAVLGSELGQELEKVGGDATRRVAQVILREIAFSEDPRLEAEIMALGAGVILENDMTMTRLAQRHGLTKAAISARVVRFVDENRLPPSSYMRSEKDREKYALTNRPRVG
jgi:hypothetical protein